jgi:hypothetical protein
MENYEDLVSNNLVDSGVIAVPHKTSGLVQIATIL